MLQNTIKPLKNIGKGLSFLMALLIVFVVTSTLLFYFGMAYIEQRPVSLIEALQFVTQTMTTVGYGEFTPWSSPFMQILVIVMQFGGIAFVFMSIPIVVTPWIQEKITLRPPTKYTGPDNHIVIAEYTELINNLLDELERRNISYVLIEPDQQDASNLFSDHRTVIHGDPSEPETLEKAGIKQARLAILDGPDERKAMIALAIGEFNTDLDIVAIAEQSDRGPHLAQAGADRVIYPRELIGRVLGTHALRTASKEIEIHDSKLGESLDIRELPILPSSPLHGKSLKTSDLRSKFGGHVVGVWRRGSFINNPPPDFLFQKSDIIVATGTAQQLNDLEEYLNTRFSSETDETRDVVIIGFGNEGKTARERLVSAGVEPTVLNDQEDEHVDVVGNGLDSDALLDAGVEKADTVIITISRDEATVMVTLMVRILNEHAEILAQVNRQFVVETIYRAGASYVECLNLVISRMLAGEALGEDLLSPELNIKIRHCGVGTLAGSTLADADIGRRFNVAIIALERDGEIQTELDPDEEIQPEDRMYVCGTDENVNQLAREYDVEHTQSS